MIGIIGAMKIEIEGLRTKMQDIEIINISGLEFYKGILSKKPVVLVECGIGKVNSAMAAAILVNQFNLDFIINIGVAGGLDASLNIYDAVISESFVHHDVDEFSGGGRTIFDADKKLIEIAENAAKQAFSGKDSAVFKGIIASGDQFINSPSQKTRIKEDWNALAVEMEGASIAQVCSISGVPFIGIRSVSDNADSAADEDFSTFVEKAAENSIEIVLNMLAD